MPYFCHLHCHSQYSMLDGASKMGELLARARTLGMDSLALTDHGNLFGVPHFVAAAKKEGIKPIIGCECYLADDRHDRTDKRRYHQILLAKNAKGYQNLVKLCSLAYTEGYYYKPRMDKRLIAQYAEGLMATTGCLGATVPKAILERGEEHAEKLFREWYDIFGEDYYIELQRPSERSTVKEELNRCNSFLLHLAKKYSVKVVATNDVHYTHCGDSTAHDILLCVQTGKDFDDPTRMRFSDDQYYLKSGEEMGAMYADLPEALANTQEVAEKAFVPHLKRDILMPIFPLPPGFASQFDYLVHLTQAGLRDRFGEPSAPVLDRMAYELEVIKKMGFEGYFLVVQDFIQAARAHNILAVSRGSAAGSLISYALGISNVDPIQYNLLFERFLNPERVSYPDIDIDFTDDGRAKIIDYVVQKYGKEQVAQIVTFGTMGAKSAIRDVARVLKLPLSQADQLAKLVPERPGIALNEALDEVPELKQALQRKESTEAHVLEMALKLEGVTRHSSIHAAGVIIAPDDITNYLPVMVDKETGLLVSQYEGHYIEEVGMLKMDFLGSKTLSIIQDTIARIREHGGVEINLDTLPLDDGPTFALYHEGATIATFQFESEGMRQWLTQLKPTCIEDLIAMNALYRPGPMQFIPNFVARKQGKEPIVYPLPLLEQLLQPTYGIMVYQEQIMQTAQIVAGYSLAQADLLRRAMGKKKPEEMEKQRDIFIQGAMRHNNIPKEKAVEVFDMMEKFAQYGFNRSHAAVYSVIAYQTAYLKANYPAVYMATVLTHNQHDLGKISAFIAEAKRMGLRVWGPNINESQVSFSHVDGETIRFGLGAIKGIGETAARYIVEERNKRGLFADYFDFHERMSSGKINRRVREALAMAGAFDGLGDYHRKQYVYAAEREANFIERLLKVQPAQTGMHLQQSLFTAELLRPTLPKVVPTVCPPYTSLEQLHIEKELLGFYLTGHPLDTYRLELQSFGTTNTQKLFEGPSKEVRLGGMIQQAVHRQTKSGSSFAIITLEDYHGSVELTFFGEDYKKHHHLLQPGELVFIIGRVAPRYGRDGTLELKPQTVKLLEGLRAELTKRVVLRLKVDRLTPAQGDRLVDIIRRHRGPVTLELRLWDEEHNQELSTRSSYRVAPIDSFFAELADVAEIAYGLSMI